MPLSSRAVRDHVAGPKGGAVYSLAESARKRIAILGGGIGSLAAACEPTMAPDWRDQYDVTVYQLGWRLGGKEASGRSAARGQRIEEHGLHVWFGCYDNAFRMLRHRYGEIERLHGDDRGRVRAHAVERPFRQRLIADRRSGACRRA